MSVSNGDVLKAAMELEFVNSTIAQNVFYFVCKFIADETEAAVLSSINTYLDDLYTAIDSWMKSTISINPCQVDEIQWDATNQIWEVVRNIGNTTPVVTFTNTNEMLPHASAPVLIANTTRPKTRGRKFLAGFCEDSQNASEIGSSVLTSLGTSLNHYLADETVSGSNVLSPGVASTVTGSFEEFASGVVNSIIGSMRKRKPGVGA